MTKQTVIEWLREIYNSRNTYEKFIANIDWEQAKAMENEQIKDAYEKGKKYKKPIKDSNPIWLNSKPFKKK